MNDTRRMDDDSWNRLQEVAERFERDCADAFPRNIAHYLPPESDPTRTSILDELLRIDLELHWRRGKGNHVEEYLARFPEVKADRLRVLQLIEEEFRVRGQFGDRPSSAEYFERFPKLRSDLEPRLVPQGSNEFRTMESAIDIPLASTGNLTKIRRIGEGGFGEVWECRAPGGVPVAVKRIFATVSPKFIEREKQSLDLICSGKFRHPFLLQVFGWWVQNNQIHVVMELADESLDDRLKGAKAAGKPGLELDDVLRRIIRDAGESLDFLNHKCRILHRDVKPANMLLMSERLKLCDFGLARMTETLGMGPGQTLGAGTPVFIAPEIVQGYQSMQSDQYSLAVSYCMLRTGRPLFRGTVKEIRDQHVKAKPSFEDSILSAGEQRVLTKALAKEPTERFANSTEFVTELLNEAGRHMAVGASAEVPSRTQASPSTTTNDSMKKAGEAEYASAMLSSFKPVRRSQATRILQEHDHASQRPGALPWWVLILGVLLIFGVGLAIGSFVFQR